MMKIVINFAPTSNKWADIGTEIYTHEIEHTALANLSDADLHSELQNIVKEFVSKNDHLSSYLKDDFEIDTSSIEQDNKIINVNLKLKQNVVQSVFFNNHDKYAATIKNSGYNPPDDWESKWEPAGFRPSFQSENVILGKLTLSMQ